MKQAMIVALICVNVALLVALTLQMDTSAGAQDEYFPRTNYIVVTGQIESGYELVYIIDMATQRLGALKYDLSRKQMVPYEGRSLENDFRESR